MRTPSPFRVPLAAAVFAAALLPALASAQAINVDFGPASSAPASTYAAAGLPGVWNTIGVLAPGERADLVGLDGLPVYARIYGVGGTAMLETNDPATSGDDEALIDDMLLGFNNPVDLCLWIEYLEEGDYEVTTYAITPNDPLLLSPVRVDFGTPGPTDVGGAWAGTHASGLSYVKHTVTTVNGKIGLHSGTYGAGGQAGVNALQIRPLPPVGADPVLPTVTRFLSAIPNPARGSEAQQIMYEVAVGERVRALEIVDVTGRVVWRDAFGGASAQGREFGVASWDGTDGAGRELPAGIYFARLDREGASSAVALRIVRL